MSGAPENLEDISEDPGHAFALEMGMLEFCITQLENELTDNNQDIEDLNDEELQVCCFLSGKSQNLPLHWV
jgi:hypothetical protein